jgi:hypothetical protein
VALSSGCAPSPCRSSGLIEASLEVIHFRHSCHRWAIPMASSSLGQLSVQVTWRFLSWNRTCSYSAG